MASVAPAAATPSCRAGDPASVVFSNFRIAEGVFVTHVSSKVVANIEHDTFATWVRQRALAEASLAPGFAPWWLPYMASRVPIWVKLNLVAAVLHRVDTSPPKFVVRPATDRQAAAMFRATVNLFSRWGVTDAEASTLLDLPVRTYRRWKAGHLGRIGRDGKARLSNLGWESHKALRTIFAEPRRGYEWMRMPNTAFAGRSALQVMLGGELTDLMRVRRYLDAETAL